MLETTEITERYKDAQGDMDELEKFAGDIAAKCKTSLPFRKMRDTSVHILYQIFKGCNKLLTFHRKCSYNGQYKVTGNAVDLKYRIHIKSDYMQQKAVVTVPHVMNRFRC